MTMDGVISTNEANMDEKFKKKTMYETLLTNWIQSDEMDGVGSFCFMSTTMS